MPKTAPADLYARYYVDNDYERLHLFQLLAERYDIRSVLYPGSFVHVTPSFVYPVTVYVDTDKRAKAFFDDPRTQGFIAQRKTYADEASVTFHAADYTKDFGEDLDHFDLLISQYGGFVSQYCKRYLKIGALLLANNSHGDASMASIDNDYKFIAAVLHNKGKYRLDENDLDAYFIPKANVTINREYLEKIQRGIGYKKSASAYLFRRVQ